MSYFLVILVCGENAKYIQDNIYCYFDINSFITYDACSVQIFRKHFSFMYSEKSIKNYKRVIRERL